MFSPQQLYVNRQKNGAGGWASGGAADWRAKLVAVAGSMQRKLDGVANRGVENRSAQPQQTSR
jgi:hypothetical protein